MVGKQSLIAYTIMVQRTDGKWLFLVQHEESDFIFPGTMAKNQQTGLATAIEAMKEKLNLNFDKVDLAELTNAVTENQRIPLFVFKYHCGAEDPTDLLLPGSKLEWQVSDNFKEAIQKYDISGVPLF